MNLSNLTQSTRNWSKSESGIWTPDPLNYNPIRKSKHFDPQPVAGNIPIYADIWKNPSAEDTPECIEFWEEQFDYCVNGYETGGIWIPGRYYYYLNFSIIDNLLVGKTYPWFTDLDLEFFRTVEWIKQEKWMGIIAPKARRKGLSEKGQTILNHGARFIDGYQGGVAAGISNYVDGIKNKIDKSNIEGRPELKTSELLNNEKKIQFGYKIKNIYGKIEESGSGSLIRFATMYDDPKKFEGEYFHDVICEESGEFPLLDSVVESILPAMMMGSEILGTFYIYGTGGNILSSSRAMKDMYERADELKLIRFPVTGQRMTYPFIGLSKKDEDYAARRGKTVKSEMPTFDEAGWTNSERIGCEDVWKADEWIQKEDERYQKINDPKKLREHRQNFPRNEQDIFTSAGKNNFNADILYLALNSALQERDMYKPVVLDFEYVEDNFGLKKLKLPLKINVRAATDKDPSWKIIHVLQDPLKGYEKVDFGGIDAYEMDETVTSPSKGGIVIYRDYRFLPLEKQVGGIPGLLPVLYYYDRPPNRLLFFEQCLKVAVWFNMTRRMMVSAEHQSCIDYFRSHSGQKYLAFRPKSMESPNSEQTHKFGIKMTTFSKPRILGLAQDTIEEFGALWRCEPIIRDYLAYDEENIGTDWDLADASNHAFSLRNELKHLQPERNIEEDKQQSRIPTLGEYYYTTDGVMHWRPSAEFLQAQQEKFEQLKKQAGKKEVEPQQDYMIG